jgi:hypothetical protein
MQMMPGEDFGDVSGPERLFKDIANAHGAEFVRPDQSAVTSH